MNLTFKTRDFFKKYSPLQIFFVFFVAAYVLLLLIKPNLGPVDDYMLLRTLQSGHPIFLFSSDFPYGNPMTSGRFTLLWPAEYNFFSLFFESPSAFWYFLVHAFQYVVLMVIFVKIISKFTSNKYLIYLPPILLSFMPNVAVAWFRTHLGERNVAFFFAAFLLFYLSYLEKPKLRYLILGIISANIAIYYKESTFIALAAFCFSHLFLSWKKIQTKTAVFPARKISSASKESPPAAPRGTKILDGLILLSSFIFLLLYYFIVYRNLPANAVLYNYSPFNSLLVYIKNILNYAFFSDPIILILLPFTGWRIYKFARRKLELHPIYDSMLIAGSMFVLGYIVLKVYNPSYLLPAYIFALPPLIYFFSQRERRTILSKGLMAVCGIVLIFNALPTGIHYITYYKYLSVNFNKTLDFLVSNINNNYSKSHQRSNIFIDATDPISGASIYFILEEFLWYRGLSPNTYDLKSNVKTDENEWQQNTNKLLAALPFSVFQSNKSFEISKGDYLIITPDSTTKNINNDYIQSLSKSYDLVFKTQSPLAFPDFNLKTLLKYIVSSASFSNQKLKGLVVNENLVQQPDYYVFKKR